MFIIGVALDAVAGFSSLLQAAVLVRQNKLRGASVKEALRFACVDVFVKTKSSSDSKKQALMRLDEILSAVVVSQNEFDLLPPAATQDVRFCSTKIISKIFLLDRLKLFIIFF